MNEYMASNTRSSKLSITIEHKEFMQNIFILKISAKMNITNVFNFRYAAYVYFY